MTVIWRAEHCKYLQIDGQRSSRGARLLLRRSPGLIQQVGGNSNVNGHAERPIETGAKVRKTRVFWVNMGFLPFLALFSDDVSMTSLVGHGEVTSADVIG